MHPSLSPMPRFSTWLLDHSCLPTFAQWCGAGRDQRQRDKANGTAEVQTNTNAARGKRQAEPQSNTAASNSSAESSTTTDAEDTPSISVQLGEVGLHLVSRRASTYYGENRTSNFQQDSTGVFPWWGGIVLASWLSCKLPEELLNGKRCIELGCGAYALPSLVAGARGASVSATDGCDVSLNVVRRCLAINMFDQPDPEVRCLSWTDPLPSSDIKTWDLVVFADVLYKPGAARLLAKVIDELLVDDEHGLVLGTMGLRRGGGASLEIYEAMRERGFAAQSLPIDDEVVRHAQAAAVKLDQESSFDAMGSTNWSTDLNRNECRMVKWSRSSSRKWEDDSATLYTEAAAAREANIGQERAEREKPGLTVDEWLPTE